MLPQFAHCFIAMGLNMDNTVDESCIVLVADVWATRLKHIYFCLQSRTNLSSKWFKCLKDFTDLYGSWPLLIFTDLYTPLQTFTLCHIASTSQCRLIIPCSCPWICHRKHCWWKAGVTLLRSKGNCSELQCIVTEVGASHMWLNTKSRLAFRFSLAILSSCDRYSHIFAHSFSREGVGISLL